MWVCVYLVVNTHCICMLSTPNPRRASASLSRWTRTAYKSISAYQTHLWENPQAIKKRYWQWFEAHSIGFRFYLRTDTMGYWAELRAWLLRDPAKLIRYLVLFVCSIVVIVQLYECFSKLSDPPISTHSYYNVNETIEMPAITLCREPAFKEDVLTVSWCYSRI